MYSGSNADMPLKSKEAIEAAIAHNKWLTEYRKTRAALAKAKGGDA